MPSQHKSATLRPFLSVSEYEDLGALRWFERDFGHSDDFKSQYLNQFRSDFGYLLPTCELMNRLACFLASHRQLIDAGSGSGYLSQELARLGLNDTIAVDTCDYREHRTTGYTIRQVHRLDVRADATTIVSAKHIGSVLLAWPPLDFPFALRTALAMRQSQILVYQGEDKGGCTANDAFFDYVADVNVWVPMPEITDALNDVHVVMPGFTDGWKVWKKIVS